MPDSHPGRRRPFVVVLAVAALMLAGGSSITAQTSEPYYFYLSATDGDGVPIRNLAATDVTVIENGRRASVARVEPFSWPVKVSVLVDNNIAQESSTGLSALGHLRSGLTEFFNALPGDVEVSLVATAPNPRWLVRPTTDRIRVRQGISLLTPDEWPGRFTDALVEYARRLELELGRLGPERLQPYLPVLVSIGSSAADGSEIRRDPVVDALQTLERYRVSTAFFMLSPGGAASVNDGASVLIAKAAQEITGGRYHALAKAASSSLTRLLPDLGREIAARHVRQTSQYRVTVNRPDGAEGPITSFSVSLSQEGSTYRVSADGSLP